LVEHKFVLPLVPSKLQRRQLGIGQGQLGDYLPCHHLHQGQAAMFFQLPAEMFARQGHPCQSFGLKNREISRSKSALKDDNKSSDPFNDIIFIVLLPMLINSIKWFLF
jgi:hypothetical protein